MWIVDLPNEILDIIFSFCDSPILDYYSLCQSNRALYCRLLEYLYYQAIRAPTHIGHLAHLKSVVKLNGGGVSPLQWGRVKGIANTVYHALINGANVGYIAFGAPSLLFWAAENGHENIVTWLIETPDVTVSPEAIQTSFRAAIIRGHTTVVDMLLSTKIVQVDAKDRLGRTPVLWASKEGHRDFVDRLLEFGASVDSRDKEGWTPLLWAARNGHERVVDILLRGGASVQSMDREGLTPLMWAAQNGHARVVEILLESGASVNAQEPIHGRTSLFLAAMYGHEAVVQLLLKVRGVEVGLEDKKGQTPFLAAAIGGCDAVVTAFLGSDSVDVNSRDSVQGLTALCWAAKCGHDAVLKVLLICESVDVNLTDFEHRTPLSWAAGCGYLSGVRTLLAADGVAIDLADKYRRTPMFWARKNGFDEIVKFLSRTNEYDSKDSEFQPSTSSDSTSLWSSPLGTPPRMSKLDS